MQKVLKILVIRFSSIGDIVLTTPVIRCLKKQLDAEIHFLTKGKYSDILSENPYLEKIHFLDNDINETISNLKQEGFDYVIDLHNNIRSRLVALQLRCTTKYYYKSNLKKLLLIKLGINILDNVHVVDRYMKTVHSLGVKNDNLGLDYFLPSDINLEFDTSKKFICWSIGASYINKKISLKTILEVSDNIKKPLILLGGIEDYQFANNIINKAVKKDIYNFCGELNLSQSAYLIKNSSLLLTNDSGMMHIGSAFKKTIISFWGCTKPSLGFWPYFSNSNSIEILANYSNRPCSKHGSSCRNKNQICINSINSREIIIAYKKIMLGE